MASRHTPALRPIHHVLALALAAGALACASSRALAAVPIVSCDRVYRVQASRPGWITIARQNGKPATIRISHQIEGGKFSQNDGYLVLYGIPAHADPHTATTHLLTLYQINEQPRTIVRRAFETRIRSAEFSADGQFLAISTQLGVDVLDFKRKKFEHHAPGYEPDFPLAVCNKHTAR